MEVLKSFGHFVLLTQFYFTVSQDMITIIRNPGEGNHWTDLDQFKLPDSNCSSVYCTNWKAFPLSQPCHCECSYSQEATFGFYSGSWTCLDNTEVRKQTDCKYKFESEDRIDYPPPIVEQDQLYHLILPSRRCSVESKTTRYFTCDGSWAGIDSKSWFSITREKKLDSPTRYRYKLKIKSHVDDVLRGRIISLNINCTNQDPSCLLFKFKGTLHCAENFTFATTAKPSPTRIASDKIPIAVTATATALAVPNATAISNGNGKKEKPKASGGSSTVVGVAVALVIILVIVIVIVAYVYLKRKRGEAVWLVDYISSRRVRKTKSTQANKKTVDERQEEPVYAEIPEQQRNMNAPVDQAGGIYSYAFDDPRTAYIASQLAPYNKLVHNREGPDQTGHTEPQPASYNRLVKNREGTDQTAHTEPQPASYNRLVHNREGPDQIAHIEPQPV